MAGLTSKVAMMSAVRLPIISIAARAYFKSPMPTLAIGSIVNQMPAFNTATYLRNYNTHSHLNNSVIKSVLDGFEEAKRIDGKYTKFADYFKYISFLRWENFSKNLEDIPDLLHNYIRNNLQINIRPMALDVTKDVINIVKLLYQKEKNNKPDLTVREFLRNEEKFNWDGFIAKKNHITAGHINVAFNNRVELLLRLIEQRVNAELSADSKQEAQRKLDLPYDPQVIGSTNSTIKEIAGGLKSAFC